MKKVERIGRSFVAVILCMMMLFCGNVSVWAEPEATEATETLQEEVLSQDDTSDIEIVNEEQDDSNSDVNGEEEVSDEILEQQTDGSNSADQEIQEIEAGYIFEFPTDQGRDVFIQVGESGDSLSEVLLTIRIGESEQVVSGEIIENVAAFHLPADSKLVKMDGYLNGASFRTYLELLDAETGITLLVASEEPTDGGTNSLNVDVESYIATETQNNSSEITEIMQGTQQDGIALFSAESSEKIVVIDPGHSKNSPGTYKTWDGILYREEELTLKIANYVKAALEEYSNVTVYLTRNENDNPTIYDRVSYASNLGADILVSIHLNSAGDVNEVPTTANGVEAMVAKIGTYNPDNAQAGQELARAILNQLVALGFNDRGFVLREGSSVYEDGSTADYYGIVRYGQQMNVPSIIVEHGFLNNESDFRTYLSTEEGLRQLGIADAKGIAEYLGLQLEPEEDGWHMTESGGRYYISNGVRLTGWQTLEGNTYYFGQDGIALTGTPIIEGEKYWFDGNGVQRTGWLNLAGMRLYFDPSNNGIGVTGVLSISEVLYLFDENGVKLEGTSTPVVNGNKYYLVNGVVQTGWLNLAGMRLYFDPANNGVAAVGVTVINGNYYNFNSDGILIVQEPGMFVSNGKKYYVLENGRYFSGWIQLTADWRLYFDPNDACAAATGIREIDGEVYYFDSNGVMLQSVMPVVNGKKYLIGANGKAAMGWIQLTADWRLYFDPTDNGAAATGFRTISGKTYYFDVNGIMHTAGMPIIDGIKYMVNSDGSIYMGWLQLTDTWRLYCDPDNNGAILTGFQRINGNRYYFDSNGIMAVGFQTINGNRYCFSDDGVMYTGGTPVIDGKKYGFDGNGIQIIGWYNLAGYQMYFNPDDNGAAVTGNFVLDNIVYVFNDDGVLIDSSVQYVTAVDPNNGRTYTLESTFVSDPQIGTDITEDEFFAAVVYAEAGNQGLAGQTGVALTILNRVESSSFPDTLSFVIYAANQFEVARNGTLTRYLEAFRDNDQSVLYWIERAESMQAVNAAKSIMNAYKTNGTKRVVEGITMPQGQDDFCYLFFMTPAAFERLGLDEERCNSVTYRDTIFFENWVRA